MVTTYSVPLYQRDRLDRDRLWRARMFAAGAHAAVGQVRKYTLEPYIVHPEEVAEIVASAPHITEMVEAAYLHDVVEDTGVSIAEIRLNFGPLVAHYVDGLTNIAKPEDGNRAARFQINLAHSAQQCAEVQTIKVADVISNTSTIVEHDPAFARVYLEEKRQVLLALTKAHPDLLARAWQIIKQSTNQLEQAA